LHASLQIERSEVTENYEEHVSVSLFGNDVVKVVIGNLVLASYLIGFPSPAGVYGTQVTKHEALVDQA
jgi:hypothetical protein